jgi:hypothetical protein
MIDIEPPARTQPVVPPKPVSSSSLSPGRQLSPDHDNSALEHITKCPTSALNYLIYHRQALRSQRRLTFSSHPRGHQELFTGRGAQATRSAHRQLLCGEPLAARRCCTAEMATRVMKHYRLRMPAGTSWPSARIRRESLRDSPRSRLDVNAETFGFPSGLSPAVSSPPRRLERPHLTWSRTSNGHNRIVDHKAHLDFRGSSTFSNLRSPTRRSATPGSAASFGPSSTSLASASTPSPCADAPKTPGI